MTPVNQGPFLVNIALPTPAAGADISYRIPQSLGLCRVAVVIARLTTSAIAADRSAALVARNAQSDRKGQAESPVLQTASQVLRYTWGLAGTAYQGASLENVHVPMSGLYVIGGDLIATDTNNISAADQWDNAFLWLEVLGRTSRPEFPPGFNPSLPSGRP